MSDRFHTNRLWLRPMTTDDIDLLVELNADAEVMQFITGRAMSAQESATELQNSLGERWLLFAGDDDRFLGWVGATPIEPTGQYDIGWRLHRSAWGNGFATEAARWLIEQLFDQGAERIVANTMAVNRRSRAVMDRIGLTYIRTFYLDFDDPLPGTDQGEVEYGITQAQWKRRSNDH